MEKDHLSKIRNIWERKHETGEWKGEKNEIKRVIDFFESYKDQIGTDILDLGSGQGRNALPLAERGYNVTCIELTEVGLKQTKEKLKKAGLKANLVQGDQAHLPFRDEKFDTVISIQSFQFNITKWDAEKAFAEATRVLKPGGIFFLRVRSESFNIFELRN